MITRVAITNHANDNNAIATPIRRAPRTATITPMTASASATSSFIEIATIAAGQNHAQRFVRAAQYANINGPIANASGWKNSHTSHCDVGCNRNTTPSAVPVQRECNRSRASRYNANAPLACDTTCAASNAFGPPPNQYSGANNHSPGDMWCPNTSSPRTVMNGSWKNASNHVAWS